MNLGNPIFDAAFALELATLERLAPVPEGPLGYGTDLSCTTDCTENFDEVDPYTPRGISQALYRRLTTTRGTIIDDTSYGYNVKQCLNRGASKRDMQSYCDGITGECGKDDRVDSTTCGVTFDYATSAMRFAVKVTPKDPSIGVFTFTFSVTPDGEVLLETIV